MPESISAYLRTIYISLTLTGHLEFLMGTRPHRPTRTNFYYQNARAKLLHRPTTMHTSML